jgi:DHA1 family inner membrane transport protein
MSTAPASPNSGNDICFQIAAVFAGWLGGRIISSALGLRLIYRAGALLTAASLAIAFYSQRRDRQTATAPR